jgi:poly [ADP-ribose] polymerase 10/14/15
VLNHRVVLHAIDATPARWRGDAGSSPLDRARTAASSPTHPTHWLISTQAKSKAQKAIISEQQEELQNFRDSVVGMRAVVKAAAPGGGGGGGGRAGPPAAPARWYWEESPARLAYHPVVKPPHWIPYEDAASARLEKAFVARQGKIQLTAAYEADVQRMIQTNLRTGFSRNMLRDAPPVVPVARPASRDVEQGADRPSDIDADEPCMVLHVGSIVQIARERDDGWAFGSLMLAAAGAPTDTPPVGWNRDQGWFEMENTEVPSADQLAELQKALGGSGGASALDPPAYWDEVKNPLEGELFRLDPRDAKTRDEYNRVLNAFMLTLNRSNFRIYSIDRVQNVSLWQSYSVKKSQICAREEDESKALRKYVRCWLFHGCPGDIVPKILQQGFNRSFCGKNATFYGKGVYFARDAKYSTYPLYCRPDPQGVQSIFLVRAVVGQYCKGVKDALTPGIRDNAKNLLFDSTVDTDPGKEPSIYVTYHDAQAYPEYLIKFSQTNVPKAHPSAGEAPHRMYRHNILEAEGIE